MNKKTILTVIITLCCLSTYAQSNKQIITEFSPNNFVVKAQKISDLVNYNWLLLKEIYKSKSPDTKIKIEVKYDENGTFDHIDENNFMYVFECKSSGLGKIISELNGMSERLKGISDKLINNIENKN